ncbi:MAG: diaminopimelate decarboxylase [Kiloniellales bacterium]
MPERVPDVLADAFEYRDGWLHAEDVALARIAEAVGTPAYVYATAAITAAYRAFEAALDGLPATICYSVKANSNLAVIGTLAELGAGADVVSEGELRRALAAGVPARRIVFAGCGKTHAELAAALDAGILQINVESEPELKALSELAAQRGLVAPVALRVNPDVDAETHNRIATGRKENKFGIDIALAPRISAEAAALPGIALQGLAVHIGSQVTSLEPFRTAFARIARLVEELRADGHAIPRLDLGGGIGIRYRDEEPPSLADYMAAVRQQVGDLGCQLVFEPGRILVGNAGILLSRVLYVKDGQSRRFVVVDAAMNDLLRPSMYDAYHEILPVHAPAAGARRRPVDVVGPVCETGDLLASDRPLPPLDEDDLLAICGAGAYGSVMASTYNTRLPAPEVLVKGREFAVVRARPTYDQLLAQEALPAWLDAPAASRGAA